VEALRKKQEDEAMEQMNWTEIILGVFTLLSTCGWFVSGRKHRQEVEGLKADNRQKDMELGKMYVDEFRSNIADPLRQEVLELREQIDQLRNAIQRIDRCPHRDTCPVYDELRKQSQSS
jgi:hypothetical protein